MIDLDELIAEARRLEGDYSDNHEVVTHMSVLADALEAAGAERDAAVTEVERVRAIHRPTMPGYGPRACVYDGRAWPCPTVAALDGAPEAELDAALARIADLEQSLRIASLGRRVDATLLHEYERRFAEAAKLHRREPGSRVGWCSHCNDNDGPWPCPTAVALGLNEGESK